MWAVCCSKEGQQQQEEEQEPHRKESRDTMAERVHPTSLRDARVGIHVWQVEKSRAMTM
jgi:hypothetical protein